VLVLLVIWRPPDMALKLRVLQTSAFIFAQTGHSLTIETEPPQYILGLPMYEELEQIAQLKFGREMESISGQTREKVTAMQGEYAARAPFPGSRSGPHEAAVGQVYIDGAERLVRTLSKIWIDLIKQRKGHISRSDVEFIAGKVGEYAKTQKRHLETVFRERRMGPACIGVTHKAETRMRAVAIETRRDLEIMAREYEAFPAVSSKPILPAPERPSPNSNENPTPPTEKPDKSLFVGIIGSALPLVLATLIANGVDLKWQLSVAIYIFLACVCAWSFWKYAVPHKRWLIRYGGALLFFSVIVVIGIYGTAKQYYREHSIIEAQPIPRTPAGTRETSTNAGNQPSNPVSGQPAKGSMGTGTIQKGKTPPLRANLQHGISPGTSIQQKSTGDCSPNNIGSGNTFNVNCAPQTEVMASPQVQRQTGNPDMPWQVVFTISSTAPVLTGDLRLSCTGPTIRAAISRINPAFFASGNNGPSKDDPNTVVYELEPEMLSPGKTVTIVVYSKEPIMVISGSIGSQNIIFPK